MPRPAGVILRDHTGAYYAIPVKAMARFRVPAHSRAALEAFLTGDGPIMLPVFAAEGSVRMLHTTRRSNELWLVLS